MLKAKLIPLLSVHVHITSVCCVHVLIITELLSAGPRCPHTCCEAGEERWYIEGPLPRIQEKNGEDANEKSVWDLFVFCVPICGMLLYLCTMCLSVWPVCCIVYSYWTTFVHNYYF